MQLDLRHKELVAIAASVGAGCRPCIEHHIRAAREAGATQAEIAGAVRRALEVRARATELFVGRVNELLGDAGTAPGPATTAASDADELVALGASLGANSHALLRRSITDALAAGLTPSQVELALKTAEYVQSRAAEMTADKAATALDAECRQPERST